MRSDSYLCWYNDPSFPSASSSNLADVSDWPQPELSGFFRSDSRPEGTSVKLSRRIRTYSHRPSIFISLPRQHSSGAVAYSDRGNAHVAVERKRRVRMAAPHRADKRAAVRSSDFGRCRNLHSHGDLFIFDWEREPLVEATQVHLANLVDRALTDHDYARYLFGGRPERIFKKLANRFAEAGTR